MISVFVSLLSKIRRNTAGFFSRQSRNFKVILIRRPIHAIAKGLSVQYNSIYATALGANPVQLGSLSSVGNAIAAIISLPAGWLLDGYSLYFFASSWVYLYAAVVLLIMGSRITCTACTVTCAKELPNEKRATGRGVCRTMSSLAALLAPIGAATLISASGGYR